MPQMAPIMWLFLFFIFLMLTYFLSSYLFFLWSIKTTSSINTINPQMNFHWKW
uniref:ATP synthase F0 subunit 8 n=1 Tax=Pseudoniphargus longipes TaxID=2211511 RepID=A0A345UDR4_9CRUS|nr:ATP synthase F0 subunit 8 [Pseudoniphargus longipes]